jgi:hypothetical protein
MSTKKQAGNAAPAETPSSPKLKHDTKSAAAYLGLAPNTLEKLRTYGGGPQFLKFGSRVLYEQSDLDKWIEDHRRTSTADAAAR